MVNTVRFNNVSSVVQRFGRVAICDDKDVLRREDFERHLDCILNDTSTLVTRDDQGCLSDPRIIQRQRFLWRLLKKDEKRQERVNGRDTDEDDVAVLQHEHL